MKTIRHGNQFFSAGILTIGLVGSLVAADPVGTPAAGGTGVDAPSPVATKPVVPPDTQPSNINPFKTAQGSITSIDKVANSFKLQSGNQELQFSITTAVPITYGTTQLRFEDLKVGNAVRVTYHEDRMQVDKVEL